MTSRNSSKNSSTGAVVGGAKTSPTDQITKLREELILAGAQNDYSRRTWSFGLLWVLAIVLFFAVICFAYRGVALVENEAKAAHCIILKQCSNYSTEQLATTSEPDKPIAQNASLTPKEQKVSKTPDANSSMKQNKVPSGKANQSDSEKAIETARSVFSSSLIYLSVTVSVLCAAAVTLALSASKIFAQPEPEQLDSKISTDSTVVFSPVLNALNEVVKALSELLPKKTN